MATDAPRGLGRVPALPRTGRLSLPGGLRLGLDLVAVALLVLFLATFASRNLHLQHDLRTYLLAGRSVAAGMDPYSPADLETIAGRPVFPYVYPAVTLAPFIGLSALPAGTVAHAWMWGGIVLLGLLVLFWWRRFGPRAGLLPIALAAVFGWNRSALWDLSSGNVALVEAALLWAGFACFLSGRRAWFAALVVAAACFKLAPAVFLLLLLVPDRTGRPGFRTLLVSAAALALAVGGPLLVGPAAHWERFWAHLPDASAYGDANPSALGLAVAAVERLGVGAAVAAWLPRLGFALYALALAAVSLPFLRSLWRARDLERLVMAAVCLYVLLSPRPMAYGFILAAPAPFFFAPRPFRGAVGALLLACVLCAPGFSRTFSIQSGALVFTYAALLLTLCVWLLVLDEHREARLPPPPASA